MYSNYSKCCVSEDDYVQERKKDYASFCYACISTYPTYSWVNHSMLVEYLETKEINVPDGHEKCNERHANDELPEWKELPGVYCPLGVCVKLRGVVTHPNKKLSN